MNKKVFAAAALAATLALGLCACGSSQASSSASASSSDSASAAAASASSAAESSTAGASSASSTAESSTASASGAASASAGSAAQFATMEELIAAFDGNSEWEYDDKELIYSATDGASFIRAWVDLTPEANSALKAAGSDTDKQKEAIGPLTIDKQEVFAIPAQSELDALIGKTGAELEAEGFAYDYIGVSGPDTVGVGASKAPFFYMVTFDGHVDDMDTPDVAGAVADFKVKSVDVTSLSRPEDSEQS